VALKREIELVQKVQEIPKKKKVSKSSSSSSSSEGPRRRTRPKNILIQSKINENKKSKTVSIFSLGNNSYGQCGFEEKDDVVNEPTLIDKLDDINCLDVSGGSLCNLVVEANNTAKYRKVYSWGTVDYKRDKSNKKLKEVKADELSHTPTPVSTFDKMFIVQATAGDAHCAVLTLEGDVYTWGIYKDKKGNNVGFKPGRGADEFQEDPEKIETIPEIVVQIGSTANRTVALTQAGEVFEWGNTRLDKSQKVMERNAFKCLVPTIVNFHERIKAVFCCAGEQIFALGEKEIYCWGINSSYQLGINKYQPPPPPEEEKSKGGKKTADKSEEAAKKKKADEKSEDASKKKKTAPKKGDKPKDDKSKGEDDEKSKKGDKSKDEKSKGEDETKKKVTKPRAPPKKKDHIRPVKAKLINALLKDLNIKPENIRKICGGYDHTVLLLDEGEVYIWGSNKFGQLGLGKKLEEEVAEPTKLTGLGDVMDISCGAFHTLTVNREGEVYGFGLTRDGRLPSENETENKPIKICGKLKKHRIVQVVCGKRHNLLVGTRDD
jgi:alpha-tubulin suppressor-like RCC1 family protein